MCIRGVIFDLDGTLVDSRLDFDQMRREMGIAGSPPLLETISQMPRAQAERCWQILLAHEHEGARRASPFPGVVEFLAALQARALRLGVVTRNSRLPTLAMLERLGLELDPVLGRDEAPVKPHPAALWKICETWNIAPAECVMIGDYRFDIEAARRAGMHAGLFTGAGGASGLGPDEADFVLERFDQPEPFWNWLAARKST